MFSSVQATNAEVAHWVCDETIFLTVFIAHYPLNMLLCHWIIKLSVEMTVQAEKQTLH